MFKSQANEEALEADDSNDDELALCDFLAVEALQELDRIENERPNVLNIRDSNL